MIEIKPHLGWQGGVPDCDSGLDAVWVREPGAPTFRAALAHRQPGAALITLLPLSESQIEAIKKKLRERPCEKDQLTAIIETQGDFRPVLRPLPPEASDPDEEDDDDD